MIVVKRFFAIAFVTVPLLTTMKQMHANTIILGGEAIPYAVRKSPCARRVSVTIGHDGGVRVTLPRRASLVAAQRFLKEKGHWIVRTRARLVKCTSRAPESTPALYRKHKRDAERLIRERIAHFNRYYQFTFSRISIRNQKTRWGSCSSKKNLQFNYRLIFLPSHLLDYVVVHELCHLAVANHGPRFRAALAQTIPEYKTHERQLRQYRID